MCLVFAAFSVGEVLACFVIDDIAGSVNCRRVIGTDGGAVYGNAIITQVNSYDIALRISGQLLLTRHCAASCKPQHQQQEKGQSFCSFHRNPLGK